MPSYKLFNAFDMTKPQKRPRGKPLRPVSKVTVDTIVLAQAMELVDDITILRCRAQQIVAWLSDKEGK